MTGKQIDNRTPQEERQQEQRENLKTAIAKLMWMGRHFAKDEHWAKREKGAAATERPSAIEFKPFTEILTDGRALVLDETIKRTMQREKNLIKQVLADIENFAHQSSDYEFYKGHPVYEYALQYLDFLQGKRVEADQSQNEEKRGRQKQTPAFVSYFTDKSKYNKVLQVLKQHQQQGEAAQAAKIILAAQELGYIIKNLNATALHRALKPLLNGLASERAFRAAIKTGNPQEYKTELEQA